jgi:hypothetical protein
MKCVVGSEEDNMERKKGRMTKSKMLSSSFTLSKI